MALPPKKSWIEEKTIDFIKGNPEASDDDIQSFMDERDSDYETVMSEMRGTPVTMEENVPTPVADVLSGIGRGIGNAGRATADFAKGLLAPTVPAEPGYVPPAGITDALRIAPGMALDATGQMISGTIQQAQEVAPSMINRAYEGIVNADLGGVLPPQMKQPVEPLVTIPQEDIDAMAAVGQQAQENMKARLQQANIQPGLNVPNVVANAASSVIQQAPIFAATALGGPMAGAAGLAAMGVGSMGARYQQARAAGYKPEEAMLESGLYGLAEVIPEKLGMDAIFAAAKNPYASRNLIEGIKRLMTATGLSMTAESLEETATQLAQNTIRKYARPDSERITEKPVESILEGVPEAAVTGGVAGGALGGGMNLINQIANRNNIAPEPQPVQEQASPPPPESPTATEPPPQNQQATTEFLTKPQAEAPRVTQPANILFRKEQPIAEGKEPMVVESKRKPTVTIGEAERRGEAIPQGEGMTVTSQPTPESMMTRPVEQLFKREAEPTTTAQEPISRLDDYVKNFAIRDKVRIKNQLTNIDKIADEYAGVEVLYDEKAKPYYKLLTKDGKEYRKLNKTEYEYLKSIGKEVTEGKRPLQFADLENMSDAEILAIPERELEKAARDNSIPYRDRVDFNIRLNKIKSSITAQAPPATQVAEPKGVEGQPSAEPAVKTPEVKEEINANDIKNTKGLFKLLKQENIMPEDGILYLYRTILNKTKNPQAAKMQTEKLLKTAGFEGEYFEDSLDNAMRDNYDAEGFRAERVREAIDKNLNPESYNEVEKLSQVYADAEKKEAEAYQKQKAKEELPLGEPPEIIKKEFQEPDHFNLVVDLLTAPLRGLGILKSNDFKKMIDKFQEFIPALDNVDVETIKTAFDNLNPQIQKNIKNVMMEGKANVFAMPNFFDAALRTEPSMFDLWNVIIKNKGDVPMSDTRKMAATLSLTKRANLYSVIHEMGHAAFNILDKTGKEKVKAEYEKHKNNLGAYGTNLDFTEFFADMFALKFASKLNLDRQQMEKFLSNERSGYLKTIKTSDEFKNEILKGFNSEFLTKNPSAITKPRRAKVKLAEKATESNLKTLKEEKPRLIAKPLKATRVSMLPQIDDIIELNKVLDTITKANTEKKITGKIAEQLRKEVNEFIQQARFGYSKIGTEKVMQQVTQVIEGKPVPPEVLAEYPELKEQKAEGKPEEYGYEMNARPFSIGAQPKGHTRVDEGRGGRWGTIYYDKPLTETEIRKFELKPIENESIKLLPRILPKTFEYGDKPTEKKYYKRMGANEKERVKEGFEEVPEAKPFKVTGVTGDYFITKVENKDYGKHYIHAKYPQSKTLYAVSDGETGYEILSVPTVKEATEKLKTLFGNGKLRNTIDDMIKSKGRSPRYNKATPRPKSGPGMFGGATVQNIYEQKVEPAINNLFKKRDAAYAKGKRTGIRTTEDVTKGMGVDLTQDRDGKVTETEHTYQPKRGGRIGLFNLQDVYDAMFGNGAPRERKITVGDPTIGKQIEDMYKAGDKKVSDVKKAAQVLSQSTYGAMKQSLVDTFMPYLELTGKDRARYERALAKLHNMFYLTGPAEAFMRDMERTVLEPLNKAGYTYDDYSAYRMMKWILSGRQKIKSKWDLASAQKFVDSVDPKARKVFDDITTNFNEEVWKELLTRVKESGLSDDAIIKNIMDNENYSPFFPTKMLGLDFGSREYKPTSGIYKLTEKGYSGDIQDPLSTLAQKAISMLTHAQINDSKREGINIMKDFAPGEITPAKVSYKGFRKEKDPFTGKEIEIPITEFNEPPSDSNMALMTYKEGKETLGYYVPKQFVEAFEAAMGNGQSMVKALEWFNKGTQKIRNVWIEYNPLWQTAINLTRDIQAALVTIPKIRNSVKLAGKYVKVAPAAVDPYMPMLARMAQYFTGYDRKQFEADVTKMLKEGKLLATTDPQYLGERNMNPFERLENVYNLKDPQAKKGKVTKGLQELQAYGKDIERLTKVAAELTLREDGTFSDEEMVNIIRRIGSPAFGVRGGGVPFNAVKVPLLFYNAIKEGWRAGKYFVEKDPVGVITRAAIPMAAFTFGAIAAAGGFGDEWRKAYQAIKKGDRENKLTVPLWWKDNGEIQYAAVALPQFLKPFMTMTTAAIERMAGNSRGALEALAKMFKDEAPTLNPILDIALMAAAYGNEKPPQNRFGSPIMTQDQWEEGGGEKAFAMLKSLGNDYFFGSLGFKFPVKPADKPLDPLSAFYDATMGRIIKSSFAPDRDLENQEQKDAESRLWTRRLTEAKTDKEYNEILKYMKDNDIKTSRETRKRVRRDIRVKELEESGAIDKQEAYRMRLNKKQKRGYDKLFKK